MSYKYQISKFEITNADYCLFLNSVASGDDYYESDYMPEEYAELNENIECISIMNTSYLPQLEAPSKVIDIINEYWK